MARDVKRVAVAVGVGSNLGNREAYVARGVRGLACVLRDLRVSPVYETAPRGDVRQPDFLNLCCVGTTEATARSLLESLQSLERAAGRRRTGRRFGPRTLDLDLLLYGEQVLREPGLEVPHPRLSERAFVLIPLRDVAPGWRHPVLERTVADLAGEVGTSGVRHFGEAPTVEEDDAETGHADA